MPKHLSKEERKYLEYLLRCNRSMRSIAAAMDRNVSVISREISRSAVSREAYRYGSAHRLYLTRRKEAKFSQNKLLNNPALAYVVEKRLRRYDSPEQIAGRLKLEESFFISTETIYQWIYKHRRDLQSYLRCQKGQWKRRRGTKKREKRRRLQQFRCISERPEVVEERSRLGDWEGDTVISKNRKHRILTYVERKSGFAKAEFIFDVSAPQVQILTQKIFRNIPACKKHTITFDRGTEFGGDDALLEKVTKTQVFRAHAYHSWERGTNENWNGLLRKFFPKGTNFATINHEDLKRVVKNLNHRPRKRLNYYTPHEVFVLDIEPSVAFHTRV